MSSKISADFNEQKEYTENVSHEIQTPLAIISAKADELLQSENLNKNEMEQLETIMNTTSRLARINQALILLTKIDNKFYAEKTSCIVLKLLALFVMPLEPKTSVLFIWKPIMRSLHKKRLRMSRCYYRKNL